MLSYVISSVLASCGEVESVDFRHLVKLKSGDMQSGFPNFEKGYLSSFINWGLLGPSFIMVNPVV